VDEAQPGREAEREDRVVSNPSLSLIPSAEAGSRDRKQPPRIALRARTTRRPRWFAPRTAAQDGRRPTSSSLADAADCRHPSRPRPRDGPDRQQVMSSSRAIARPRHRPSMVILRARTKRRQPLRTPRVPAQDGPRSMSSSRAVAQDRLHPSREVPRDHARRPQVVPLSRAIARAGHRASMALPRDRAKPGQPPLAQHAGAQDRMQPMSGSQASALDCQQPLLALSRDRARRRYVSSFSPESNGICNQRLKAEKGRILLSDLALWMGRTVAGAALQTVHGQRELQAVDTSGTAGLMNAGGATRYDDFTVTIQQ
jgi:hypothetical protein